MSAVSEAQKLMSQAADLLPAIHSTIQYGIQSQNDTTKGGMLHNLTHATASMSQGVARSCLSLSLSPRSPNHDGL